jgi:hypothetical protein
MIEAPAPAPDMAAPGSPVKPPPRVVSPADLAYFAPAPGEIARRNHEGAPAGFVHAPPPAGLAAPPPGVELPKPVPAPPDARPR